ncbi:WD40/YVTN/BNR-like repeat-containing protein [Arachidicoccus sp.]|uniref:WD40/YVTN/BNR-like repeat-containing protein n=1 Tax=Arachidicoccus sp. TaxID=1872624 RepID=UPI003D1E9AA6
MKKIALPFLLLCSLSLFAQKSTIRIITQGTKTNLRGLSIINKNTIWASGSNGKIAKSTDDGTTWQWLTVKGFNKADFRDIQALAKNTAIIMAIDTPAYLLKTLDGGSNWKIIYANHSKGMFLDAMDFSNYKSGIVVGDPIGNKIFLAISKNSGNTWTPINTHISKKVQKGEAFFAASGSNIILQRKDGFYLVSGGTKSKFFTKNTIAVLPLMQGKETTGANAIDVYKNNIAIVGGDFMQPDRNDSCFCFSRDNGKTWQLPKIAPGGYRSDVIFINKNTLVCCGLTGVDISKDGGNTWKNISKQSFNTCRYNKVSNTIFFVGQNGTIGKLLL